MVISIPARFHDGLIADARDVLVDYEAYGSTGNVMVRTPDTGELLVRWPAAEIFAVPARKIELRLGANGQPAGARLVVTGRTDIERIRATLPVLEQKQRLEFGRQVRIGFISTLALAAVILAYIYGVPLLASRLVGHRAARMGKAHGRHRGRADGSKPTRIERLRDLRSRPR